MEIKRLIVGMVQTNCYIAVHPEMKEAVIVDPGDEAARIEDALAQTVRKRLNRRLCRWTGSLWQFF